MVNVGNVNIEVLGTAFNVTGYPQDSSTNTVLVEGSVALYQNKEGDGKGSSTFLKPGFKAEWKKNGDEVSIENVDTSIYTAWIQGKINFS